MHQAFHPGDNVNRLYATKNEERWLERFEACAAAEAR